MSQKDPNLNIISRVIEKRGYILPYHELFYRVDPDLLAKYDVFYESLTLKTQHLDNKTKELVWLGILMSVFEEAGTIHLKRAREAGITDAEISDIIMLTQVALGFNVILFVKDKWGEPLSGLNPLQIYENLLDRVTEKMTVPKRIAELVFIGIYSTVPIKEALRFHLKRAKAYGFRAEEIAEAMSYIFIPRGANILIGASEVFQEVIEKGASKRETEE